VKRHREARGLTLVEVLVAVVILAVGLLGIFTAFPTGYLDVVGSGGQSKAVSYARQQIEVLKNQAFTPNPPANGSDSLEGGLYGRSWTITQVAGTVAPYRLWRVSVTVSYAGGTGDRRQQNVTLNTMRAE
jgi:prepilin-type N-terminal cleavage/methylation domain-containing protein